MKNCTLIFAMIFGFMATTNAQSTYEQNGIWDVYTNGDYILELREEFVGKIVVNIAGNKDLKFPLLFTNIQGDTLEYLKDPSFTFFGTVTLCLEPKEVATSGKTSYYCSSTKCAMECQLLSKQVVPGETLTCNCDKKLQTPVEVISKAKESCLEYPYSIVRQGKKYSYYFFVTEWNGNHQTNWPVQGYKPQQVRPGT